MNKFLIALTVALIGYATTVIAEDTNVKVANVAGCAATIRTIASGTQTIMQCPDGTVTTNYPDGSSKILQPSGQIITLDAPK